MKLSELCVNQSAKIVGFELDKNKIKRLNAMGVKKDCIISLIRYSFDKKIAEYLLNDMFIAIKNDVSQRILVQL